MYEIRLSESSFPAQSDGDIREITVGDLLREIAAGSPNAAAIVDIDAHGRAGRTWTYAELLAEAETLALALSSRFRPGERVVVWAPNVPEWLLMEYGCALAGLVLVTANPSFQAGELRYVLEQSGAVGLFLVESFRGNPMSRIALTATEGLPAIREIVRLDEAQALHRRGDHEPRLPEVSPGDPAQIQYTSGTTGFPKGAVLSHRSLVNNARLFADRAGVHQGTVWANFMPLFHTAGCATGALGSLQAACKMLLIKQFDPSTLARLIESEKVSTFFAVPTMLIGLLEALDETPRDVSSMHSITTGGAPVAPELVRRVRARLDCHLQTAFGQTEASPMISLNHQDGSVEDICETAGQPLPCTEVSIRSVEDNDVLAVDTVGEICVRGYCTMIGYHANESATAAAIDADGWLHTGDLGAMDARGFVRVTGRVKDMIIRGGENHFPAEIESVLIQHSTIAEVAVVGLPDERWGEIIACFVRTDGESAPDVAELRRFCRAHLSPQKTPSVWCRVAAFPLTGSGKVQKFALREKFLAGEYGEGQT